MAENDSQTKTLMSTLETMMHQQKASPRNTAVDEDGFVMVAKESLWTKLYGQYYMDIDFEDDIESEETIDNTTSTSAVQDDDDMLFYVQSKPGDQGQEVKVYRKNSKALPGLGDPHVNWEESVYLNMIMHSFDYYLTCAVCARLPTQDLKVLCKQALIVHASHHMRRMDSKGESSDLSYPNIFFIIDSYDEMLWISRVGEAVFESLSVQEDEIVCVELTARYKGGGSPSVIFLGSVKHEALLAVYDAKLSIGTRMVQMMPLQWVSGNQEHYEYIRMRGPHGKGYAEMRIGLCRSDLVEYNNINKHRSLSDKTSNERPCTCHTNGNSQIYNTTTRPDHCPKCDKINSSEGGSKVWSSTVKWFQSKKKTSSTLSPHLTYVTLPWSRIMKDLLLVKQKPVFLKEKEKKVE